jgi:hypothetical protein
MSGISISEMTDDGITIGGITVRGISHWVSLVSVTTCLAWGAGLAVATGLLIEDSILAFFSFVYFFVKRVDSVERC